MGIGFFERGDLILPFTMSKDCVVVCLSGDDRIHGHADEKGFDPGFKLFGKTIPVRPAEEVKQEEHVSGKQPGSHKEQSPEGEEEVQQETGSSSEDGKDESMNEGKAGGQKTVLKKPDKLLPCPRCQSMDTKFCYYNNYNVNQPRHFCKNCQRYWTAGGTLRNVPVGAGRRKNKHSVVASTVSSHYRQVITAASECGLGVRSDDQESGVDQVMIPCAALPASCVRPLKVAGSRIQVVPVDVLESGASTGTVLNFGSEARNKIQLGGDSDPSIEKSTMESSSGSGKEAAAHINPAAPRPQMDPPPNWANGAAGPAFFGGAWSYGWNFPNPAWNAAAAAAALAPGAPGWPGLSWPMIPGSYFPPPPPPPAGWGPGPWVSGPWAAAAATTASNNLAAADSGSPTLGKRPQSEDGCLWVPKTLRIDDPGEAAKSSIWTTLGLGDKPESAITSGGIFKAFQPKTQGAKDSRKASQALQANPAAFSRSISFHESS